MITSEQMANIYWRRMRRGAIREIDAILSGFRGVGSLTTQAYWKAVKACLGELR